MQRFSYQFPLLLLASVKAAVFFRSTFSMPLALAIVAGAPPFYADFHSREFEYSLFSSVVLERES
jgi:hypothetical protein